MVFSFFGKEYKDEELEKLLKVFKRYDVKDLGDKYVLIKLYTKYNENAFLISKLYEKIKDKGYFMILNDISLEIMIKKQELDDFKKIVKRVILESI